MWFELFIIRYPIEPFSSGENDFFTMAIGKYGPVKSFLNYSSSSRLLVNCIDVSSYLNHDNRVVQTND